MVTGLVEVTMTGLLYLMTMVTAVPLMKKRFSVTLYGLLLG
jgi:hypothetical protein